MKRFSRRELSERSSAYLRKPQEGLPLTLTKQTLSTLIVSEGAESLFFSCIETPEAVEKAVIDPKRLETKPKHYKSGFSALVPRVSKRTREFFYRLGGFWSTVACYALAAAKLVLCHHAVAKSSNCWGLRASHR